MTTKNVNYRLQIKREKKELKRRRKKKSNTTYRSRRTLYKIYRRKITLIRREGYSGLSGYLKQHFYNESLVNTVLEAPSTLCFENNIRESLKFISKVYSTLRFYSFHGDANIKISFEKCQELKLGPLMLLNIIIMDFFKWRRKANNRGVHQAFLPTLELDEKMSNVINNKLFTMHFPVSVKKADNIPVYGFRLLEGQVKAKDYLENSKGRIAKKVRNYINTCIRMYDVELNETGTGLFDNMIGEILANADDHSLIDKWYVYGSFSLRSENPEITPDGNFELGELNLIFLNFGNSIYKGFEDSKDLNPAMYADMDELYKNVINSRKLHQNFSREGMFTLYGLQEGFSRLLHKDRSRGIGTMTFIRSFLELGYNSDEYKSILYILSGNTLIKCSDKYKPFFHEDRYYLSLNKENTLTKPPSNESLFKLNESFPGTLLMTKLFLNKNHLKSNANE